MALKQMLSQLQDENENFISVDEIPKTDAVLVPNNLPHTLKAIHECVYGSTIRHIIKLPTEVLLHYLSTFPFYRGVDILYYFLLQLVGKKAHYSEDGRHLVTIQPELLGVYIIAQQDIRAFSIKDVPETTIYPLVNEYISRTILCQHYQLRNEIILGEARFSKARKIPSISLNVPVYQKIFTNGIPDPIITAILITNDCWDPFQEIDPGLFQLMLNRLAFVCGSIPNLWALILKDYYKQQFIRLRIYDVLSQLDTRQIIMLNNFYPELVNLPPDLDILGIRIWFSPRNTKVYLLGMDTKEGLPSDEAISDQLRRLKQLGIERYTAEITGIKMDENNLLTGQIGIIIYPELKGKRLINLKDISGKSLNLYYPHDMYPLISGENVVIITLNDIMKLAGQREIDFNDFRALFNRENIPYLIESPTLEIFLDMFSWITSKIIIKRGIPARIKLVETMALDIVDY